MESSEKNLHLTMGLRRIRLALEAMENEDIFKKATSFLDYLNVITCPSCSERHVIPTTDILEKWLCNFEIDPTSSDAMNDWKLKNAILGFNFRCNECGRSLDVLYRFFTVYTLFGFKDLLQLVLLKYSNLHNTHGGFLKNTFAACADYKETLLSTLLRMKRLDVIDDLEYTELRAHFLDRLRETLEKGNGVEITRNMDRLLHDLIKVNHVHVDPITWKVIEKRLQDLLKLFEILKDLIRKLLHVGTVLSTCAEDAYFQAFLTFFRNIKKIPTLNTPEKIFMTRACELAVEGLADNDAHGGHDPELVPSFLLVTLQGYDLDGEFLNDSKIDTCIPCAILNPDIFNEQLAMARRSTCMDCGNSVPEGNFCSCCGNVLCDDCLVLHEEESDVEE